MTSTISRRTLAKGAAWTVPAVTVGAAAPAFAASTTCQPETCAHPRLSAVQVLAARGIDGKANITFTGAITATIGQCTGLFSLGVATLTQVEIQWTSNARPGSPVPAGTTTTTTNLNLALGVNALGLLVIPTALINVSGVPNVQLGLYTGVANIGLLPSRPTKICFYIRYTRILGGGLPPQECQAKVCVDPVIIAAVGDVGLITGLGLVTYTIADVG
ncbi:hypothetical protein [Janibacter massiliensis]|uniref:hypothetical protein n=1 Tax=Janibacter massiliensis TaxID=2058291 RepID=UPI000D0EFC0C|nr:hypothetical protein [Janibacter massiliensis]